MLNIVHLPDWTFVLFFHWDVSYPIVWLNTNRGVTGSRELTSLPELIVLKTLQCIHFNKNDNKNI